MSDNSNGPGGCAAGCGFLLIGAVVLAIVKAVIDAVTSLVAAVVAAITAAVIALGLAALGSFSAIVTLAMAWFVIFKLNPRAKRFDLSGAHAGLLAGSGVTAVAVHALLLWIFGSFSLSASALILGVNGMLALSVAFLPALVTGYRLWKVKSKEREAARREAKQARTQQEEQEQNARRKREREASERTERDYLDVAEIGEMIAGVDAERERLQEKIAVAVALVRTNLANIERWSKKPGREENVAALEADNVNLGKFVELAISVDEALEARCNAHRGRRHFLKTLRGLPKLPRFPNLAVIDDGVPPAEIEDALSTAIEEMQAALHTLEERTQDYVDTGHAQTYLTDYEKLIDTYDRRRDDADMLLSRVRTRRLIDPDKEGRDEDEDDVVLAVDNEINGAFDKLRTRLHEDCETLAQAELLDVSGELALLEQVKSQVEAGNESMEEIAELLGSLRRSKTPVLAPEPATVEQT
jgi:hypothetical protein